MIDALQPPLRREVPLPRIGPHPRREPQMSLMDKIKSMFSGDNGADDHAAHDHSSADHSHEPVVPPIPPVDPAGMPTSAADTAEEGENR